MQLTAGLPARRAFRQPASLHVVRGIVLAMPDQAMTTSASIRRRL